jgi:hypothetical protein
MNLNTFLKLIQETKNLSFSYTLHDLKYCFEKSKSLALASVTFSKYVILEKRINYEIFRKILIPCLAERRARGGGGGGGGGGDDEMNSLKEKEMEIIKSLIEIPSNKIESLNLTNYTAQNLFTQALLSHR